MQTKNTLLRKQTVPQIVYAHSQYCIFFESVFIFSRVKFKKRYSRYNFDMFSSDTILTSQFIYEVQFVDMINVTIVLNQMYINQSKSNGISFRIIYIHLMYDDGNIYRIEKLYLIFFMHMKYTISQCDKCYCCRTLNVYTSIKS